MKSDFFLRAVGDIDTDLITQAESYKPGRRIPRFMKYAATAACVLFFAAAVLIFAGRMPQKGAENASPEAAADFPNFSMSGELSDIGPDGKPVKRICMYFYRDGAWSAREMECEDGAPGASALLDGYLREAGSSVRCISAGFEETAEKDGENGKENPAGMRTVRVVLSADPGEDTLRGLVNTVLCGGAFDAQYVKIEDPDGALTIGGVQQEEGFSAFPME